VILVTDLAVDPGSGSPINQQIKSQLAWKMASGQLKPGERLPSVRSLSTHLKVNIQTVRTAYRRLEEEGLVVTRHGFGTIVQAVDFSHFETAPKVFRTHTIGIILPTMVNPFYHAFIEGVEKIAAADGSLLFLCCNNDDPGLALQFFRQLLAQKVDGVMLISCLIPGFTPEVTSLPGKLPVLIADVPDSPGVSVLMDLENAGYLGTRHLIEHGHRRIGLITLRQDFRNIAPINKGYRRAMQEYELSIEEELESRVGAFDFQAGVTGVRRLLGLNRPPSAIFCVADLLALGAIREIKARGLRVPEDVAVTGFNDIPAASISDPPLTTIAAPAHEMGIESMMRLQAMIAGTSPKEREFVLPTSLVVRSSCGAHPVLT
jgi:DNA-binding LacI/PurR family transcriptional regulator